MQDFVSSKRRRLSLPYMRVNTCAATHVRTVRQLFLSNALTKCVAPSFAILLWASLLERGGEHVVSFKS